MNTHSELISNIKRLTYALKSVESLYARGDVPEPSEPPKPREFKFKKGQPVVARGVFSPQFSNDPEVTVGVVSGARADEEGNHHYSILSNDEQKVTEVPEHDVHAEFHPEVSGIAHHILSNRDSGIGDRRIMDDMLEDHYPHLSSHARGEDSSGAMKWQNTWATQVGSANRSYGIARVARAINIHNLSGKAAQDSEVVDAAHHFLQESNGGMDAQREFGQHLRSRGHEDLAAHGQSFVVARHILSHHNFNNQAESDE